MGKDPKIPDDLKFLGFVILSILIVGLFLYVGKIVYTEIFVGEVYTQKDQQIMLNHITKK